MLFQTSRNVKRFLYQQMNPEIYIKWKQVITKNLIQHDCIRRTCQKSDERKINNINKDAIKIALVLDLEDRIEKMQESES